MRVCLDTNVLVAAFATRGLCADVLRTVLSDHDLVLGEVIMSELRRVLKSKLKVPEDRLSIVEAALAAFPLVPKSSSKIDVDLRDPTDRWILGTAIAGRADVLVTGDQDLLAVRGVAPLPILDPRAFWEYLRGGQNG